MHSFRRSPAFGSLGVRWTIAQHETRAAGAADTITEIVGRGARLFPDPHLIEGPRAAAAPDRTE
jgi:hypothetical protein